MLYILNSNTVKVASEKKVGTLYNGPLNKKKVHLHWSDGVEITMLTIEYVPLKYSGYALCILSDNLQGLEG